MPGDEVEPHIDTPAPVQSVLRVEPVKRDHLEAFKVVVGVGICGLLALKMYADNAAERTADSKAQRDLVRDWNETQKSVIKNNTAALTSVSEQGKDLETAMKEQAKVTTTAAQALNRINQLFEKSSNLIEHAKNIEPKGKDGE